MKTAYFQCDTGISGDMTLGALVDAGADWRELQAALETLAHGKICLDRQEVARQGIRATRVTVRAEEKQPHRHLNEIETMIGRSSLPDPVKNGSLLVFRRLAEAEAKIHRTVIEKIHFHEVGALDAIADIVGAAMGLWLLGVKEVYSSPVNTGEGTVRCAHGTLPVPAPATLELLRGAPIYSSGIPRELTTPTGAAILATFCRGFISLPKMRVSAVGYGAGQMELSVPNVLRVIVGDRVSPASPGCDHQPGEDIRCDEALMIEANIDDMNPEFYDYLIASFLAAGAMDVFLKPIQMKKNRPAVTLSVLIHPERLAFFYEKIFAETTTLGVRTYAVTKYMLPFEIVSFACSLGSVRIKVARQSGQIRNLAPEYDDCREIAARTGIPLKQVYDTVRDEYRRQIGQREDISHANN